MILQGVDWRDWHVFVAGGALYVMALDHELALDLRGRFARIDGRKTCGYPFKRRWLWGGP